MTLRLTLHTRTAFALLLGFAMLSVWPVGCTRDQPDHDADVSGTAMRIVSLSPALSQMLVDLGLGDRIVGVAENDAAAPQGLPVVGNYADVQTEALLAAQPTHVLTMSTMRQPPERLRNLAAAGRFELIVYPYPYTIAATANILAAPRNAGDASGAALPSLGQVVGKPEAARALRDRMIGRLDALRKITADRDAPSVLIVIGSSPVMASGPGSVNDQLLAYVGARNAAAGASVSAPTYDRESLLAMQPDVILLLRPGSPPLQKDDPRLADVHGLPLPAIENNRLAVLNDPLVMLPSSALDTIAADMARAIHPDLADEIDALFASPCGGVPGGVGQEALP